MTLLSLLDTDTLSAILRQDPRVVKSAYEYLTEHGCFTFSIFTQFEILRGLKARGAKTRLIIFEQFCTANNILPLTDDIMRQGTDVYADLHRRGTLIGDADIFISATAIVHGLTVVTNNENHFRRVTGLQVSNWLS